MATLWGLLTRRGQNGAFWGASNVQYLYPVVVSWLCLLCEKALGCALNIRVLYSM